MFKEVKRKHKIFLRTPIDYSQLPTAHFLRISVEPYSSCVSLCILSIVRIAYCSHYHEGRRQIQSTPTLSTDHFLTSSTCHSEVVWVAGAGLIHTGLRWTSLESHHNVHSSFSKQTILQTAYPILHFDFFEKCEISFSNTSTRPHVLLQNLSHLQILPSFFSC